MAGEVSAFGNTVPTVVILVFVALVVGLALAVLFWLTIAWSVVQSVQRTRRERVHDAVEDDLLERLFSPEPDWAAWTADLSRIERDVVESLLDEYLRELEGRDLDKLRALGETLGIPSRSKRQLRQRDEYGRLEALTWLTLLGRLDGIADFEPQTPRERAVVARLRDEHDSQSDPAALLSVLLDGARSEYTIFGQDTLYRIARNEPAALFERATTAYRTWSRPLLIQVLAVCENIGTSVRTEDLSWLTATLEHDDEAVRAAAASALGAFGWRRDIRDPRLLARLVRDPSPQVRGAVYEMLGRWGDENAVGALVTALRSEENERTRLAGTNALVEYQDQLAGDAHDFEDAWRWSLAHAAFDQAARQRDDSVS